MNTSSPVLRKIHTLCLGVLLAFPLTGLAQEEGAPGLCTPIGPDDVVEVHPLLQEGILLVEMAEPSDEKRTCYTPMNPDGTTGYEGQIQVVVADEDGEIPGELLAHPFGDFVWVIAEDAERMPDAGKNPTATVQFLEPVFDGDPQTPLSWGESVVYDLAIATEATPNVALVSATPEASLRNEFYDGDIELDEPCQLPQIAVAWEVEADSTGYWYGLTSETTPAGESYAKAIDTTPTGGASGFFVEAAEEYCLTLVFKQLYTGNPAVSVEPICLSHSEFLALLEPGQSLCAGNPEPPMHPETRDGTETTDTTAPEDVTEEAETGADGESDAGESDAGESDSGCQHGQSPLSIAWVLAALLALHRCVTSTRRNKAC